MSEIRPDPDRSRPRPGYDAVVFDLLTALIDSWSLWNRIAGSDEAGLRWRREYLRLTYGAGTYRPYETIIAEAAEAVGMDRRHADELVARWRELEPWPEARDIVAQLRRHVRLGVVTNCSVALGHVAAALVSDDFDVVVTAEEAGFYKPRPEPYRRTLEALGTPPARTLFVAGSAADVPGAAALGMPVYWHNRIGLPPTDGTRPDYDEASLDRVPSIVS
jgi:2-haloacid dehalogenase